MLTSIRPGRVGTKTNTAACLVLEGVELGLLSWRFAGRLAMPAVRIFVQRRGNCSPRSHPRGHKTAHSRAKRRKLGIAGFALFLQKISDSRREVGRAALGGVFANAVTGPPEAP